MVGQVTTVERHALSDETLKALNIDFSILESWEQKRAAAEFVINTLQVPPKGAKARCVWDEAKTILLEFLIGRPPQTEHRPEIFMLILGAVANGESLSKGLELVNEKFGTDYKRTTFYSWMERIPSLADSYARARRFHAHSLQDDALDKGDLAKDRDTALAARIHTETRLALAARWNPSEFSDKRNGSAGITINLNTPIGNEPGTVIDHDGGFSMVVDVTPQK